MNVKDIFKNEITVTDLDQAIDQASAFSSWDDGGMVFDEFELVGAVDANGKSFKVSRKTGSGKSVPIKEYWTDLHEKLKQLK